MTESERALRKFIDERKKMRGLHHNDVMGLHAGDNDRECMLRVSDMESILAELDKLRAMCACAYQLAGVVDAPLPWLDALSEAANGLPFSDEDLLPVGLEQLDAFGELQSRREAAESLLREMLLATQQNYLGDLQELRWKTIYHLNHGAGRE